MSKMGWFTKWAKMAFRGKGEEGKQGEKGEKRINTFQKLIVFAGIGAAIMIFSSFITSRQAAVPMQSEDPQPANEQPVFASKDKSTDMSMSDYESFYENQLKEILEEVIGIGEVSVMVNLDSSEEVIVEKDINTKNQQTKEVDKDRATRDITDSSRDEKVVLVQGEQGEQPIVVKRVKPKVRGVLVVAKGAENMKVKAWITEAVQKALHVEPHKISILPKKG